METHLNTPLLATPPAPEVWRQLEGAISELQWRADRDLYVQTRLLAIAIAASFLHPYIGVLVALLGLSLGYEHAFGIARMTKVVHSLAQDLALVDPFYQRRRLLGVTQRSWWERLRDRQPLLFRVVWVGVALILLSL